MAVLQRKDADGKVVGWFAQINYRVWAEGDAPPTVPAPGKRWQTGPSRTVRRNAKSKRQAETLERDLLNQRDADKLPGQMAPERVETNRKTLAAYLEEWLAWRSARISDSTQRRYRQSIRWAIDSIGSMALEEVSSLDLARVYASITDAKRSAKTALNTHRALHTAFQDAIEVFGLVTRNPAVRAIAPRASKFESHVITPEELARIMEEADTTWFGSLVRLAAWTGMRLGEALALRWDDVDLEGHQIQVRRSLNTRGHVGEVKTKKSRRTVHISPETVAVLRGVKAENSESKLRAGRGYTDSDYVFVNELGHLRQHAHVKHQWDRVRKATRVFDARFHDLRHCHATTLLTAGWTVADVSERLGHSTPVTTLNVYAHAIPQRSAELAKGIDAIFAAK